MEQLFDALCDVQTAIATDLATNQTVSPELNNLEDDLLARIAWLKEARHE